MIAISARIPSSSRGLAGPCAALAAYHDLACSEGASAIGPAPRSVIACVLWSRRLWKFRDPTRISEENKTGGPARPPVSPPQKTGSKLCACSQRREPRDQPEKRK